MIKLRDYQIELTRKIDDAWERVRAVLAVLSTGAGKTVIFCAKFVAHVGAGIVVVHRKEIISQISCCLAGFGVKHRVVAPPPVVAMIRRKHLKKYGKSFVDPNAPVGVASVQTLTSAAAQRNQELQRWLAQITLAVFDEGHHYVRSGVWARAVESLSKAKLLFVTATPERADGKGLGAHADGYVEEMVEGPSTRWLIAQGYLSPFEYKAPTTDLDLHNLPITASGDVNTKEMRKRIIESHLVGDVVAHYFRFAYGKRTIVFANDVPTAGEHTAAFCGKSVKAVTLHGGTDAAVRERELDGFEDGTGADVMANVDLFDEGFDVPGVDAVLLARKTESLAKFLQMCGRALRPVYADGFDLETQAGRLAAIAAGPKPFATIIDAVRNWERHGLPNWPRVWTLDSRPAGESWGASDTIPQKVCKGCTQPYEAYFPLCPYQTTPRCAEVPEPAGRSSPEQVDGDLMSLDVEGMAAMFDKMDEADMSDEEYALDQIRQGIPPAYRAKDAKRHRAAKYRRKVLQELVGWWIGMQPADRSLSEKHRRFYYRFEVDIGTAFTLKARETDELIARVQQRFAEDMAA